MFLGYAINGSTYFLAWSFSMVVFYVLYGLSVSVLGSHVYFLVLKLASVEPAIPVHICPWTANRAQELKSLFFLSKSVF